MINGAVFRAATDGTIILSPSWIKKIFLSTSLYNLKSHPKLPIDAGLVSDGYPSSILSFEKKNTPALRVTS